jgi:DNA-directed RNA polymerase alpha subunit
MKDKDTILSKPLDQFALSDEFLEMVRINNFKNLGEIVTIPLEQLLKLPYFGYRVLTELITILNCYHIKSPLNEF